MTPAFGFALPCAPRCLGSSAGVPCAARSAQRQRDTPSPAPALNRRGAPIEPTFSCSSSCSSAAGDRQGSASSSRRAFLAAAFAAVAAAASGLPVVARAAELAVGEREYISGDVERLAREGATAFSRRDFAKAEAAWSKIIELMPNNTIAWRNRGDARLDQKNFAGALLDYDEAVRLSPTSMPDLYVGRGLAYEGVDKFAEAKRDYTHALELQGEGADPVALVYRGNVNGSLGDWAAAEADYVRAEGIFVRARYEEAATTCRANQALAVYEQGRREEGIRLMKAVIRRDPGFADMHVALAAAAWRDEDYNESLAQWDFTCDNISVGCSKYRDADWVRRIRRWPPSLAAELERFLAEKGGKK